MDSQKEENWQQFESLPSQATDVEEIEAEPDTYFNLGRLNRIAYQARLLSWLSVGLGAVLVVTNLFPIFQLGLDLGQSLLRLLNTLPVVLIMGFLFVVLQGISESMYVLLDIEDNTRLAATALEEK